MESLKFNPWAKIHIFFYTQQWTLQLSVARQARATYCSVDVADYTAVDFVAHFTLIHATNWQELQKHLKCNLVLTQWPVSWVLS